MESETSSNSKQEQSDKSSINPNDGNNSNSNDDYISISDENTVNNEKIGMSTSKIAVNFNTGAKRQRWEAGGENWIEQFDLYVIANALTDAGVVKASFLLLMGEEAYSIFKSNRKKENNETLTALKTLMAGFLVI